jgi:hypothetical protein
MANPFEDKQDTTGGKAGFGAFNELTSEKAYDDETLKENPGSPLPFPVENPPEQYVDAVRQIERPDYEGIQLQKFKDIKKTCEAMDDILEREYINPINAKKQEIVGIMSEALDAIPFGTDNLDSTKSLIVLPSDALGTAPGTEVVYQELASEGNAGIGTFAYANDPSTTPPTPIFGVQGQIFPDVLAAFHYPNLSNGSHGETDLPLSNGTYISVSSATAGSGEYSKNILGIGETVYHSGDKPDYAGAVGLVTSLTPLGNYYFFGPETPPANVGNNIDNVRAGSSTSISNIIAEINILRSNLRVRIGPPQANNDSGINTLRSSKHREELNTWFIEAGRRTTNISDFQGGIDSLVGNASSISEYNG